MASETGLISDIHWFPSLLIRMFPPARSAKLKIICVKKEQKSASFDTFAIQTSYIAYMVCGNSQAGAASFQGGGGGGQVPPPRPP